MKKVMIVDDEPDMVDVIRLILDSEGYETAVAYSGKECLKNVKEENPDLILLDIRMPEMDGWETLRRLKDRKVTEKTKVVILTVEKGPGIEIFGLQGIVSDYITKPFDRTELVDHIKKALA